jgi:hypothetical protein
MIVAGNRTILAAGQTVAFGDRNFEVTPNNDVGLEIQRIIQTANGCFCGLRKHLPSSYLARQTNITIEKTFIHPILLYGSKT